MDFYSHMVSCRRNREEEEKKWRMFACVWMETEKNGAMNKQFRWHHEIKILPYIRSGVCVY